MNKISFLAAILFFIGTHFTEAQSTNPAPYCNASFDDAQGFFVDDHINTVSFGTLSNASNSQYAAPHYVFYNNLPVANFVRGNTYALAVNFTTAGGCGYGIWIDYNQNQVFESGEKVSGTTGTNLMTVGGTPTITANVLIPVTAVLGNTRMRMRIVEDDNYNMVTTNELPCNASTSATDVMDWGETEDYTINISSSVGMAPEPTQSNCTVYPNPASHTIALQHSFSGITSYRIINLTGKQVQDGMQDAAEKQINISELPEGVYFVQLFQGGELLSRQKFVKTAAR